MFTNTFVFISLKQVLLNLAGVWHSVRTLVWCECDKYIITVRFDIRYIIFFSVYNSLSWKPEDKVITVLFSETVEDINDNVVPTYEDEKL